MRLTFLGTGAAEGYPALWCRCERCTVARRRGGRNLRFRSAALVNDDLLLDSGPDLVAAAVRLGVDLAPVQALLITHPHTDHLDPTVFLWRRQGFVTTSLPVIHVYASGASIARLSQIEGRQIPAAELRLDPHPVAPFQHFQITTGGPLPADPRPFRSSLPLPETPPRRYDVWTFAASHATPDVEPMFFALRQVAGPELEGRASPPALLYATDTGPFPAETWAALERLGAEGLRFNAAALDSTLGVGPDGNAHMSLKQAEHHYQELERRRLLAPRARRFAHHFSHGNTPPHEELTAALSPAGIEPSYDGLSLML